MDKIRIHSKIFKSTVDYVVELEYPCNGELTLEVPLEAFIKLVHQNLCHPVKKWTKAQQDYDYEGAIKAALDEIKRSTIYG